MYRIVLPQMSVHGGSSFSQLSCTLRFPASVQLTMLTSDCLEGSNCQDSRTNSETDLRARARDAVDHDPPSSTVPWTAARDNTTSLGQQVAHFLLPLFIVRVIGHHHMHLSIGFMMYTASPKPKRRTLADGRELGHRQRRRMGFATGPSMTDSWAFKGPLGKLIR